MHSNTGKYFEYNISLTTRQQELLEQWEKEQNRKVAKMQGKPHANYGPIGGGFSWMITPSSIGTSIKAINCFTKDEIDLTDYSAW